METKKLLREYNVIEGFCWSGYGDDLDRAWMAQKTRKWIIKPASHFGTLYLYEIPDETKHKQTYKTNRMGERASDTERQTDRQTESQRAKQKGLESTSEAKKEFSRLRARAQSNHIVCMKT